MDIERRIKALAPGFAEKITRATREARNEAEFRRRVARFIEDFADQVQLLIPVREEYTLVAGRVDAVYNRVVIEYKYPGTLREDNSFRANRRAIEQVRDYIEGIVQAERRKPERLAGVVLDGHYFVFVRSIHGAWRIDRPLRVNAYSTGHFLKLLASLCTEDALVPENLVRDFGEDSSVARGGVSALYKALTEAESPKVKTLFDQWSLQFSEVCDYQNTSKLKVEDLAARYGLETEPLDPFQFFFCLHTYYAVFIKLLAVQVVHYYTMPKLGTDLRQAAGLDSRRLQSYLAKIEGGGIFAELGIVNFLEGDFFGWHLDVWDERIYHAMSKTIATLAGYSLVSLDVDPDSTRDLLKRLYQHLMPRQLRHNLGEYYTPDWLAERVLLLLYGERGVATGRADVRPSKRLLDPACGSGTLLVIAIKRIREYAKEKVLSESDTLESILSNVVGFDLNPLAVISARANYLLALGDLLQHRTGQINIPVYLCDSIMTPQEGEDLFGKGTLRFNTVVGSFSVPKSLVKERYIDIFSNFLERAVALGLSKEDFAEGLSRRVPVDREGDTRGVEVVCGLYEKLLDLQARGINGIWARIIKNAFAPIFAGRFDYVAGNPPWVNWEHLPENYRKEIAPLWASKYGLFPHRGFEAILGKAKDDISILMTYVALDKYLKKNGKLGFLITQSVFKTGGGGKGFRKFRLPDGSPIQVLHVDDMVDLKPFEGVSNRTSIAVLKKGEATRYPMPSYLHWRKREKGKSIPREAGLEEALLATERMQFVAEPVDRDDSTSPWITGKPRALRAVRKVMGESDYFAREGVNSGGANAVYWVTILQERPDGLVIVSNVTKGAKKKVEGVQLAIEPDLLYPLVRGRDVKRWRAEPSACVILTHLPGMKLKAIPEHRMKIQYPKTYAYLQRFEGVLRQRAAFRRYFSRKLKDGGVRETGPFYSMFDVGDYSFAPYKVVWARVAGDIAAAVVGCGRTGATEKVVVPTETVTSVGFDDLTEAYFVCAVMNSTPLRFAIASYSVGSTGGFGSPHVLRRVRIPRFEPNNELHLELAGLSGEAHELARRGSRRNLRNIEEQGDTVAGQIWGLTATELGEVKRSLAQLL